MSPPESKPNRSAGEVAEAAFAQRAREAMGDAERPASARHARLGRQVHHDEVGLDGIDLAVVVGGGTARRSRRLEVFRLDALHRGRVLGRRRRGEQGRAEDQEEGPHGYFRAETTSRPFIRECPPPQ